MSLQMINSFGFSIHQPDEGSRNPWTGQPDSRWNNGRPARLRTTLEIEFEETDRVALAKVLRQLNADSVVVASLEHS